MFADNDFLALPNIFLMEDKNGKRKGYKMKPFEIIRKDSDNKEHIFILLDHVGMGLFHAVHKATGEFQTLDATTVRRKYKFLRFC